MAPPRRGFFFLIQFLDISSLWTKYLARNCRRSWCAKLLGVGGEPLCVYTHKADEKKERGWVNEPSGQNVTNDC